MAILKLMRLLIGSQWSWWSAETDGSARSLWTILARVLWTRWILLILEAEVPKKQN